MPFDPRQPTHVRLARTHAPSRGAGHGPWHVALVAGLLAASACSVGDDEQSEQDQRQRTSYRFTEVDPAEPLDDGQRSTVLRALAEIDRVARGARDQQRAVGVETLGRILAGDVLLDSIDSARGVDRWHMCKDLGLPSCGAEPPNDPSWMGDESLAAALELELDGYLWGNRIYLSFSTELENTVLAATLVHEVNHALNRSECSYYAELATHAVDDTAAFLEEYRAFFAECVFVTAQQADARPCSDQALGQLDELGYGFEPDLSRLLPPGESDPALIGAALLAPTAEGAERYGHLVPSRDVWPESFDGCPAE